MRKEKAKIVVVDDDKEVGEVLQMHLMGKGYQVFLACSGIEALELIRAEAPHLLLLDKRMPQMRGLDLLVQVRQFNPHIKVILMSADILDADTLLCMQKFSVSAYLEKPMNISDLDSAVESALGS